MSQTAAINRSQRHLGKSPGGWVMCTDADLLRTNVDDVCSSRGWRING